MDWFSPRKTRKRIRLRGPKQCHPRIKKISENGCLPEPVLKKVAKKMGVKGAGLLKNIAEKLNLNAEDQKSIVQALPISSTEKDEIIKKWLRPAQPESWKDDPDAWLDTNNIQDVMKQYEVSHPKFKFFGAVPIDFAATDPYANKKQCLIKEI